MNMNLKSKYSVFELGINNPKEMPKLVNTLQPHYCLVTGIENSHIGNFRNFRHLIDNKLKIFKSKRLISGLVNYNYEPHYINNKLNLKVDLINSESLKKFIISNKKIYKVNFIYNKRKYSIESSRGEFYINIAIISFLFIKKFIKTIKFKNFFL